MRLNGKPTDLSFAAELLWMPLGFCGIGLLIIGAFGTAGLVTGWNRSDREDVVGVPMFLLLGGFCLVIATFWHRRLRWRERNAGAVQSPYKPDEHR